MNPPVITFFNNKGGVGKTTTLYNLSNMFARRGKRVLAVDLDPQANLTSLALDDEVLEDLWDISGTSFNRQTIFHAVQLLIEGTGDVRPIQPIQPQKVSHTLEYRLIPGDLRLSQFEDILATQWNAALGSKPIGLNITSAFARLIRKVSNEYHPDVVFVDVGPNLGAINRAALIAADYVIVPLIPDLFSLQGLSNVGRFLAEWRTDWANSLTKAGLPNRSDYPEGKMKPIGYIILQHRERQSRLVASHQRWAERIPETYANQVRGPSNQDDSSYPDLIGQVRNYQSLMAFSHEARKPIFDLKPADGAIGAHTRVVQEAEETYYELSKEVAARVGMSFDS